MYQITESELRTLETNLAQLRSANERLQVDLRAQSSEATALRKEVTALRKELSDLKQQSMMQENSLTNANRLLDEYATEAKRTRLRTKAQRNGWAAAAACLAIALAVK
jgi:predicted  nucleic acid-binding Zn-ribbon protein